MASTRVRTHPLSEPIYIAAQGLVSFAQGSSEASVAAAEFALVFRSYELAKRRPGAGCDLRESPCLARTLQGDRSREDNNNGVSSAGPVHRRQRLEEAPRQEWRPAGGGGDEAAAKEAEVHVEEEEKRGAGEAGRGEVVRVRPAELLPELRRRPLVAGDRSRSFCCIIPSL